MCYDLWRLQQFSVIPGTLQGCWTGGRRRPVQRGWSGSLATRTWRWLHLLLRCHLQDAPSSLQRTETSEPNFKYQRIRRKSPAAPTLSLEAVGAADDVRISFVKLPAAPSGKFTLLKLQDVSRLHRNGPHLHLKPVLQRHAVMTPWGVDPRQHVRQSLTAGRLTRQQSLDITGGREVCWR